MSKTFLLENDIANDPFTTTSQASQDSPPSPSPSACSCCSHDSTAGHPSDCHCTPCASARLERSLFPLGRGIDINGDPLTVFDLVDPSTGTYLATFNNASDASFVQGLFDAGQLSAAEVDLMQRTREESRGSTVFALKDEICTCPHPHPENHEPRMYALGREESLAILDVVEDHLPAIRRYYADRQREMEEEFTQAGIQAQRDLARFVGETGDTVPGELNGAFLRHGRGCWCGHSPSAQCSHATQTSM